MKENTKTGAMEGNSQNKITSKFKATILLRQVRVLSIKDLSVTLLSKYICKSKIDSEVEELLNPTYIEKKHQNETNN